MVVVKCKLIFLGCCYVVKVVNFELYKGKFFVLLLEKNSKFGGCNNNGCIIICYIGGGYKQVYCIVDFKCNKDGILVVVECFEYDLNCFVNIVLVLYKDGECCYILVFKGLKVGDQIQFGVDAVIKLGNILLMCNILVGFIVYNVEMKLGKGGQLVCFVGIYVQIVVCDGVYVILCLCFGEMCKVEADCCVILGEVGNVEYMLCVLGKVGAVCWCGVCLIVCGIVMNLVDYLYGGGEGCNFGKHLVILWGVQIKGKKICSNKCIDKFIVCCCSK